MAYIGKKQAYPILLDGLKKLEYRGYDSSGIAVMNGSLSLIKKEGKVQELESFAISQKTSGNIGIGHTRWATHGTPSDLNAHPHQSQSSRLTIVHNGIIENHSSLKKMLIENDFTFQSDTDTEVLVQLIEWIQVKYKLSTREALSRALDLVDGSFAIVLFDLYNPTKLWAARRQSPLVLGLGENECILSSDAMPLAQYLDKVVYVENDIILEMDDKGNYSFFDLELKNVEQAITKIEQENFVSDKNGYESYMLKEIHEQSKSVQKIIDNPAKIEFNKDFDRIIVTACGTSWHSGLIAKYLIEKHARIKVEVEYASEFRYRDPVLTTKDLVIGISQSGETADTIAALEMAIDAGCQSMALVNVQNSTISRMVDQVINIQAGPEIGVASTKAFTNQLVALLSVLSTLVEDAKPELALEIRNEINNLPSLIDQTIQKFEKSNVIDRLSNHSSALFIGRGAMYPIALEGALKLKEISYIHAEGYPAGELKHGPIALIDENMPVIAICNNDKHLSKVLSNVQEIKARKGIIVILKSESAVIPEGLADYIIETPDCHEIVSPIIQNLPIQLLSYHVATKLGLDVDKPRNLAKSVTVE